MVNAGICMYIYIYTMHGSYGCEPSSLFDSTPPEPNLPGVLSFKSPVGTIDKGFLVRQKSPKRSNHHDYWGVRLEVTATN